MNLNDHYRKQAISLIAGSVKKACGETTKDAHVSAIFGSSVFNDTVMRETLPEPVFKNLKSTIQHGNPLDPNIAEAVACAVRTWAIGLGATHYTHWFQPMTGEIAQKENSLFTPTADGQILSEFSGKMLIRGESDASSFPSGGIRSTFEARGYTAWDPTSPMFVIHQTLFIPTVFCSYTGESLDRKTPLLRSLEALSKQSSRLLKLFGNNSESVHVTLGPEQEYFLIDRRFCLQRPDLVNCGRTLIGYRAAKGQDMEDHYFGVIRQRVLEYMRACEEKLYKLGVPVQTRHNEAAPAQFELAPLFEDANIAVDNNMLIMETLKSTAEEHGLACLLHEKPFDGVNGSGKHVNWSLVDAQGNNLFEPGATPHDNAQFLMFLASVVRAVHLYPNVLRIATATAGNDFRLGANEAPPAIISIFMGSELTCVINSVMGFSSQEEGAIALSREEVDSPSYNAVERQQWHPGSNEIVSNFIKVGVSSLPPLPRDTADRNRTSSFAFTGNKFEFRMVGASQSVAPAAIAINTIVAAAIDDLCNQLESLLKNGIEFNDAVQQTLRETFRQHKDIIFNGDNYSEAWPIEAEKRNLPNYKKVIEALETYDNEATLEVFSRFSVLHKREVLARQEILFESYCRSVMIEAKTLLRMGRTIILPSAMMYAKEVAQALSAIQEVIASPIQTYKDILIQVNSWIGNLNFSLKSLEEALAKADEAEEKGFPINEIAHIYCHEVAPLMKDCRVFCDSLESMIDDRFWSLPKYSEMMWIY